MSEILRRLLAQLILATSMAALGSVGACNWSVRECDEYSCRYCDDDDDDDDDTTEECDLWCPPDQRLDVELCECYDPYPDDDTTDDDDACNSYLTETDCLVKIGAIGDVSCAGTIPDPLPGEGTVIVTGEVLDFQAETPVGGAFLEVDGFDSSSETAPDGSFHLEVPASQRVNIKISAAGYRDTWQYDVLTQEGNFEDNFVIVAESTYRLVPGLWGVTPYPETCVIAGSVSDCAGNPLQGYGITAITEVCPHPWAAVKWFKGGFPNGTQCPASDDGLYGVVNVLPPAVSIQVINEGGTILLEQGPVPCEPGAIGVLNMSIH